MDEALQYFTEAQMHIDAFIDIPLADAFFEETDEIRAINESNEEHRTGAIASLQKAFKVIIDRLKEAFSRMTEAIKSQFMTKEEKERYKKFVSMVNSDPELAKVKVTIQDFREYEKIYDEALKKLEDEANKDDPSLTVVNEIVSVMQNKLNILKMMLKMLQLVLHYLLV